MPDWYDTCEAICGGDDFGEGLPVSMFEEVLAKVPKAQRLTIRISSRGLRLSAA